MKKLFIIDDDKLITSIYSDFFAAKGYAVSATNSSFGVKSSIRQHVPDLVLLDMNLPGLSGRGLLEIIDCKESCKIMLISGDSQAAEMKTLVESRRAHDYFVKGEPLATLGHKVGRLLGPEAQL